MSNYPTHDAISEASINLTSFHKAFGKSSRAEAVKKHKQALVDGYFGKEAKRRSKLSPNDPSSGKFAKMMCKNFEGRENFLLRETQKVFQNATKINIGQSLIEHALEATEMPPKDLLNAFMTGIPAFNSMWIEWDMGFSSDNIETIISDVGEPRSGSQFRTGITVASCGGGGGGGGTGGNPGHVNGGDGGLGGGGLGGDNTGNHGNASNGSRPGAGGGGGRNASGSQSGGAGADGIVIVRYQI